MSPLLSSSMLAATLLLGQTTEAPVVPTSGGARIGTPSVVPDPPMVQQPAPAPQRGPILSWFSRENRPVFSKITGWFKRDETPAPVKTDTTKEVAPVPTLETTPTPTSDFPRRLPNPSSQASAPKSTLAKDAPAAKEPIVQTSLEQSAAVKSPISAQFANRMGRDENFEWITGQLESEGGQFVLYYATPETIDKFHGRIVLQLQKVDMKDSHRGDLVSVRGQLIERAGVAPVYRLTAASLIEHVKQ